MKYSRLFFFTKQVKHLEIMSKGGFSHTIVDPRMVFAKALEVPATPMVLCHNHPSGNLRPSRANDELTAELKSAGKPMDINVVDHLIG
jgi:DNA repair protein RadC